MKPYEERWKDAYAGIMSACNPLELYHNELRGFGFNVGTRLFDQGHRRVKMSYDKRVASEIKNTVTRIAADNNLQSTVTEPTLEKQVGVYVSWIYLDNLVE